MDRTDIGHLNAGGSQWWIWRVRTRHIIQYLLGYGVSVPVLIRWDPGHVHDRGPKSDKGCPNRQVVSWRMVSRILDI